jgi:hypothetical protein
MFRLTTSYKICSPCSGSAGSRSYFRRIHGAILANRIPLAGFQPRDVHAHPVII